MFLDLHLYLAATDIAASTEAAIGLSKDLSQNFWSQIFQSGLLIIFILNIIYSQKNSYGISSALKIVQNLSSYPEMGEKN